MPRKPAKRAVAVAPEAARVLLVAHAHPRLSNGGAEIAAYELYRGLQAQEGVTAWFLGCGNNRAPERTGAPFSQPFGAGEYLYAGGNFDYFIYANRDPAFPEAFAALLRDLRPDVVHFHHYVNIGLEALLIARRTLPDAKIVLTLHEFVAICYNHGQMVTRGDLKLCEEASLIACAKCFPEYATRDFFLRRQYITRFLSVVDRFVSPSRFVADRYIAWGLPGERITVIENATRPALPDRTTVAEQEFQADEPGSVLRLGFFGQLAPFKGTSVLFDAARLLHERGVANVAFDIHGDYTNHEQPFQQDFLDRLDRATPNVSYHGPYDNRRVHALMRRMDAVLVPSLWWENSPIVIQEALRAGRPVLCSDIGGMAEKVRDGLDGFHFAAGDAESLAGLLTHLARHPDRLRALRATLRMPAGADAIVAEHLALYRI